MKIITVLISFVFLILLTACEKAADITSPNLYNKQGISFSYPGNWDLTEEDLAENVTFVSVESSGSAIFMLQVYKEEGASTLEEFATWYSTETKVDVPIGKITSEPLINIKKNIKSLETKGIQESFAITLLGLKVPHKREYYLIKHSGRVVYLISQLAVEDQKKNDPGFDLIYHSFSIE